MITQLEAALQLAERLNEPTVAYLIERALDEAHNKTFSGISPREVEQLH